MAPNNIRVIAICVFRHGDKILVFEHFDTVKGTPFYRPLGGGVEFGETTQAALEREIMEELGLEVTDLRLLDIFENIFTLEGNTGHEIVYVYDGRFLDASAYQQQSFEIHEDNGDVLTATWRNLDSFNEYHRLVPESLMSLLKANK